jgi:thiamine biosynthesis lipoprotein
MGGTLAIRLAVPSDRLADAERGARRVAARVGCWAARLTRFDPHSELCRLNAAPTAPTTSVGPTLGAALAWAERVVASGDGLIDVTLLDERLAAEAGEPGIGTATPRDDGVDDPHWWLERRSRGSVLHRRGGVRFDLDGVAKGWIADRALGLLHMYPAALVDADGDVSVRPSSGLGWLAAVSDPSDPHGPALAVLRLEATGVATTLGVATSGTSVHAWGRGARRRHHLIDPRTRRPAVTDVVQATIMAESARRAEVVAKTVVIAGSEEGLLLAEEARVTAAIVLLETGELLATPGTLGWLA